MDNPVLASVALRGVPIKLLFGAYKDATPALTAVGNEDGYDEPWGTLSVNLTPYGGEGALGPWELFIKAHDENEPLAVAAMGTGLFEDTGRSLKSGFSNFAIWKIKDDLLAPEVREQCSALLQDAQSNQARPRSRG